MQDAGSSQGDPTGAGVQINSGPNMPVLLNTADSATYLYLGMNTGDSGSMTIANGANLNLGYGLLAAGIGGVGIQPAPRPVPATARRHNASPCNGPCA